MVIGFPAGIYVFPTYIYFTTMRFTPPQYGLSAALGATFLLVSVLLIYWYRRVVGQSGRYATITGKGYRPRIIQLGRWRYPTFVLFLVYFIFTIAAPTFVLLWRSLLRFYVVPSWKALSYLSWDNYRMGCLSLTPFFFRPPHVGNEEFHGTIRHHVGILGPGKSGSDHGHGSLIDCRPDCLDRRRPMVSQPLEPSGNFLISEFGKNFPTIS